MFNIAATKYNLHERSLEFYVSGCKGKDGQHCLGCHNPALWEDNHGKPYIDYYEEIDARVSDAGKLISSFRIYGGEPLEKDLVDLLDFLLKLKSYDREIWIFTRFEFEEVPKEILEIVDYVKCGSFNIDEREVHTEYGVKLQTANQHIFKKGVDFSV